MTQPLRLGIAGLGTVGAGVVRIVRRQAALLEARTGRRIEISAISARDRSRDRGLPLAAYAWEDDPVVLAQRYRARPTLDVGRGRDLRVEVRVGVRHRSLRP